MGISLTPLSACDQGPLCHSHEARTSAFWVVLGSLCFFGRIRLRRKEGADADLGIKTPPVRCPRVVVSGAQNSSVRSWHCPRYSNAIPARTRIAPACGACRDYFSSSRASPWRAVEAQKVLPYARREAAGCKSLTSGAVRDGGCRSSRQLCVWVLCLPCLRLRPVHAVWAMAGWASGSSASRARGRGVRPVGGGVAAGPPRRPTDAAATTSQTPLPYPDSPPITDHRPSPLPLTPHL